MGGPDPDVLAREILAASPDMCYALDEGGRLLWWNDALAETLGYEDDALAGRSMVDFLPAEQDEDARAAFEHAGGAPEEFSLTVDVETADGEVVPHRFTGARVEVDGRPVVAGIGRDVSERIERAAELRRQREDLENLDRIGETVHEVLQAVTDAATRAGIEEVTCRRLADCELYQSVWVGRTRSGEGVAPEAGHGAADGFLDLVAEMNEVDWRRPARRALETGEPQVTQHVREADIPEPARAAAERYDVGSGIAVPLVNREHVEGVLCVYSSRPDGFGDREREALRRLGFVIGFAIHAVQTEQLVLSDTATELRFRVTAPAGVLASLSERADGPCYREWSTPTESGTYRHYLSVAGLPPAEVLTFLAGHGNVVSADHVGTVDDGEVYEVVVEESLIRRLLDVGAATTDVVAEDGESTVVAEVPEHVDVRPVVEAAEDLYDADLVSKRTVDRPVRTADAFRDPVADRLTDRQEAALRHAYLRGYFSWPRDATAEEVADAMGLSSPTLHYHLRRAESALVEAYFEYLD